MIDRGRGRRTVPPPPPSPCSPAGLPSRRLGARLRRRLRLPPWAPPPSPSFLLRIPDPAPAAGGRVRELLGPKGARDGGEPGQGPRPLASGRFGAPRPGGARRGVRVRALAGHAALARHRPGLPCRGF